MAPVCEQVRSRSGAIWRDSTWKRPKAIPDDHGPARGDPPGGGQDRGQLPPGKRGVCVHTAPAARLRGARFGQNGRMTESSRPSGTGPGVITPDGCAVDFYTRMAAGGEPEIVHGAIPSGSSIL